MKGGLGGGLIAPPPPHFRPSCVKIFKLQTRCFLRLNIFIVTFNRKL